jgi:subtilase family serine protease
LRAVNSAGTAEASVTIQVEAAPAGEPDLVVEGLVITPNPADYGESIEVAVDVRNQGGAPSGAFAALWEWGAMAGDVCEWELESLPPGGERTLRCTVEDVQLGHLTMATVDWRGEVDESDEDNNSMELGLAVFLVVDGAPDLYISEIRIEPAERIQGSVLHVGVRIHNDGGTDANGFNVSWISGEPSDGCDWRVTSLAAGASRWQQCDYTYTGRGHFMTRAFVDVDDDIDEDSEDNNEAWLEIDVLHP